MNPPAGCVGSRWELVGAWLRGQGHKMGQPWVEQCSGTPAPSLTELGRCVRSGSGWDHPQGLQGPHSRCSPSDPPSLRLCLKALCSRAPRPATCLSHVLGNGLFRPHSLGSAGESIPLEARRWKDWETGALRPKTRGPRSAAGRARARPSALNPEPCASLLSQRGPSALAGPVRHPPSGPASPLHHLGQVTPVPGGGWGTFPSTMPQSPDR